MVSASLVLYHNKNKDVENVISSVLKSPIDVLCIVDHSTNDDFKSLSDKSNRIIYLHTENDGYGKGHNTGIKEILKEKKELKVKKKIKIKRIFKIHMMILN